MSATILWNPINPKRGESLEVAAPSRFLEIMGKCFGASPFTLERKSIPRLSGMAAAWEYDSNNPFQTIIEHIETYGVIEVWAEYQN